MKTTWSFRMILIVVFLLTGILSVWAQEDPLTQTITTADGLSVGFPDGWLAFENPAGGVDILNSAETLAQMQDEEAQGLLPGQVSFLVLGPVPAERFAPIEDVGELVQAVVSVGARKNEAFTYGAVVDVMVGEWPAARIDAVDAKTQTAVTMIAFKVIDGQFVLLTLGTAHDEFADLEPTLLAMANSITYERGVPLTETITGAGMTVHYPESWSARETEDGLELANSEDALAAIDDQEAGGPAAGQAALFVTLMSLEDVGGLPVSDIVPLMVESMTSESKDAEMGELEEIQIGDLPAWMIAISEESSTLDGAILGLELDGSYVIAVIAAHTGELADSQPIMLEILGSLTLVE